MDLMKRHLTVLVASLALLLAAGVGTAYAGGPGLGLPADQTQAIEQSQNATNSIDQSATAQSAAVNVSPNVAIANKGSVDQSSSASSGAVAVNKNDAQQGNTLSITAGQSQSGAVADDNASHCCGTSEQAPKSQSIEQSQNATNSISQNAEARSVAVNASPNVAGLNKGGDCNCGDGVDQSSNASSGAVAVNKNRSQQSNQLENSAGQSQAGGGSAPLSQDTRQSQNATNSISQNAEARSFAFNASPNVALLNGGHGCGGCGHGGVRQSSGASSGAFAGNWNSSEQSNDLGQRARQSQEGGSGSCCGGGEQSQSVEQSQNATNSNSQNAEAKSFALNASPNVAAFNHGPVEQSSNASSGAVALNKNHSQQSNTLRQSADQRQRRPGDGGGCCKRCNPCHPCDCERRCED